MVEPLQQNEITPSVAVNLKDLGKEKKVTWLFCIYFYHDYLDFFKILIVFLVVLHIRLY